MPYLEQSLFQEQLGLSDEEMNGLKVQDGYFEVVAFALTHGITYFAALERMNLLAVPAQRPSGKAQIHNTGMSFGQTSGLKRKMWNEAGG